MRNYILSQLASIVASGKPAALKAATPSASCHESRPGSFISMILPGALALALAAVPAARAGLAIPYSQDASTMHLWHLNETNNLYADDSATNLVVDSATAIQLENLGEPVPGTLPYNNTSLGSPGPGYPGLTNAYSGSNLQHMLAGFNGSFYGGDFPDVTQFCNPNTGAFTFEAVINLNTALAAIDAEILSGDAGGGIGGRGWQWRVEKGAIEWDLLAGSTDNDFKGQLPTSGPDAVVLNKWYHVAITFTGQSPTNSDPASVLTMYWTPLDPSRTQADILAQYTNDTASPYGIRPLSGAPEGAATPALGIGGSSRSGANNPGNGEGIIGSMLEVRVSDIARKPNDMAFSSGGSFPPTITSQPPTNTLVGYGQPLVIGPLVSGTQPLSYQWFQGTNNLPAQTNLDLTNGSSTFTNTGSYYVVITNAYGSVTSTVAQVTVGAIATGLFPTGIGANGQPSAADIPDAHYTMSASSDPNFLGPNTLVFEWNNPIEFSPGGGGYGPTNGYSTWTGLQGNAGGVINSSPSGAYIYRTTFLLDQAIPGTVTLSGGVIFTGSLTNILINGKSTGITLTPVNGLYIPSPFTITSGFVAGLNTLDFCESLPNGGNTAIYVAEISAVGQAVAPGLPVITQQPASQTVRDATLTGAGSSAEFSVVATGRPPLTYQWWVNGAPISGATNYTLAIANPSAGAQGSNYSVVISNTSGSVTSLPAAVLTIVPTNQPPAAPPLNLVDFTGQGVSVPLSYLIDVVDSDPDHDAISYLGAAASSTNGAADSSDNVNLNGTTLVYTPASSFIGLDQFSYEVQDSLGATNEGVVNVLELSQPAEFTTVLVGGTTNLSIGAIAPLGYSFQWQLEGTNLPGATAGQVVISNAQTANAGTYVLSIANQQGNVSSSASAFVALNGVPMPKFNVNPMDWVFKGYGTATNLNGNVLTLTDGVKSEGRSAWFGWPQSITNFTASFVYQDVGGLGADGFAFVLQNSASGNNATGAGGGQLGYGGIQNSVALEFNIYAANTVGIALQANGNVTPPFTPTTPVNLASGDPIAVTISYSAGTANLTLTDLTTTLSTNLVIDVPSVLGDTFENIIGSDTAYVGFTGGDGGVASTQTISNFSFMPPSLPLAVQPTGTNSVVLSWTPTYSGFVLQSTPSLTGTWTNVTATVNPVGGQYQVTAPLSAGAQFYRLILP